MHKNNAKFPEILASHQSGTNYNSSTSACIRTQLDLHKAPAGEIKLICEYDKADGSDTQTCITWLNPDRALQLGIQLIQLAGILPAEVNKLHEQRAEKKLQRDQAINDKLAQAKINKKP